MRPIRIMMAACSLVVGLWSAQAFGEADKPIIAHLFADSASYDGRQVTVYGLVIETSDLGRQFLLQDVSQMPLKVVRIDGNLTMVGEQLLIEGRFFFNDGRPYLEADRIRHAKVVGGGGCC